MKFLIYLLLIINTAFFAWKNMQPSKLTGSSSTEKTAALSSQVQRLLLLSEVDPQTMQPLVALKTTSIEKEIKAPVTEKESPSDINEKIVELSVDPEPAVFPEIVEIEKLPAKKMKQIVLEKGKEITPEVQIASEPPGQDKIISQQDTENQDVVSKVVALFNNLMPETSHQTCFSLQDIDNEEHIIELKEWLSGLGAKIKDNNRIEQIARSYWVYLEPAASKEDALTTLVELERSGAKDYARLRGGDMRNAISLGLFSQSASTRRRVVEMHKLGFKPKVKTRYKDIIHYGIKAKVTAKETFDTRLITKQFPELPAPAAENCEQISFSE
jgi:hypothetical protein